MKVANSHIHTVHLNIIKVFIHQLMRNRIFLKTILKFTLKINIKRAPTCFGSITIIRERIIRAC